MKKNVLMSANNLALIFSAVTTLVYLLIYLCHGQISSIHTLNFFSQPSDVFWGIPEKVVFPFYLSRAWDIVFIYVFCFYLYLGINYLLNSGLKEGGFFEYVFVVLISMILLSVIDLFTSSFASAVSMAVLISLVTAMIPGLMAPRSAIIVFSLVISFLLGISFGFMIGLLVGLLFSLVLTVIFLTFFGVFTIYNVVANIVILVQRRLPRYKSDIDRLLESSNQWGSLK